MNNYRITKYNPVNRNSERHFQLNEWTCPSEVGKYFNGIKFVEADYFDIESKYINAAVKLIESNNLQSLRVVNLNTNYMGKYFTDPDYQWLLDGDFKEIDLFEDKPLDISEIKILLKMILRNFMSCSLEVDGKFKLHFGYDYYMYASTSNFDKNTIGYIEKLGLYVEDLSQDTLEYSYEFSIDVGFKDERFVENTIYLSSITRDKIRKGLNLSFEHPCNHSFQITTDNCFIFSDQVEFDFSKNDYYFNCSKNYH